MKLLKKKLLDIFFKCGIISYKQTEKGGREMKNEKIIVKEKDLPKMRIPLPLKTGGAHGHPKGKKGYNRKSFKNFDRE